MGLSTKDSTAKVNNLAKVDMRVARLTRGPLNLKPSVCTILQILSVSLFQKTPLRRSLSQIPSNPSAVDTNNQLNLFK
jgi:hypothetical protein